MNVYWCGGEDIDFASFTGGWGGGTRPAWSRIGANVASGTSLLTTPNFGALTPVWAHAQCQIQDGRTTANQFLLFLYATGGTNAGVGVVGTGTSGQVAIVKRNNAGALTILNTSAASVVGSGTTLSVDFFVNYSTTGQATLWIGGVLIADTGAGVDVTSNSLTSVTSFQMGSAGPNNCYYTEVIIADSDTRAAGLWLLNNTTAGNAQTWTGTATNVNKTTINDATFISAASAGLIEEFKTGGIALPAGTYSVAAVKMSSRAQGGSAGGPTKVEYVTRVGSTDYVGGTWTPPVGGFGNDTQNYMQALNPGTGVAWTTADLTAATFNYGVESVT